MKRSIAFSLILFCALIAHAQVPKTLSYQGKLSDANGPLNGSYSLTFVIYDGATAGNPLWTETANNVTVANGILSLTLGKINPINISADKPMWLGITVGTNPEISPRVELTGSLYSLGLALPYAGSVSGVSNGIEITTNGNGGAAGKFINQGASTDQTNYPAALWAEAQGATGLSMFSKITDPANTAAAYEGFTQGAGSAASFHIFNPDNSSHTIFAQTYGTGTAAYLNHNGPSGNIIEFNNSFQKVASIDKQGNVSANKFIGDGSELTNLPGGFSLPYSGSTSTTGNAFAVAQSASSGPAGLFQITNPSNGTGALYGTHFGAGWGVGGFNYGTGFAGIFQIFNTSNSAAALYSSTNGTGPALDIFNNGTNIAGRFRTSNPNNSANALYSSTDGTGSAGKFETSNVNNSSPVIEISHSGTGNAITANAPIQATKFIGDGSLLTGISANPNFGSQDISTSGTLTAGATYLLNNSNSQTLLVQNNGTGRVATFNNVNPSAFLPVLAVENAGSGTSAYFRISGIGTAGEFVTNNTASPVRTLSVQSNGTGRGIDINMDNVTNGSSAININHSGTGNAITANAPIQATKFIGDGSMLTGITGAQGPQGPAGPVGATGPKGDQGITGAKGDQGPKGMDGILLSGAAAGNTPFWNGTSWVVNSSNIFNNGGTVGIGTSMPYSGSKLHVNGQFVFTDGTQGVGKVLTSDVNGVATWAVPASSGWGLTGTSGTIDGTNFIGTTDNVPLNFRVNNQNAGRIDVGNTFFGLQAGQSNTAANNTALGYLSMRSNTTGHSSAALGSGSLANNTTGYANVAIGPGSMGQNTTGNNNTSVGTNSLSNNLTGGYNAALGSGSLFNNTAYFNTGLGASALQYNTTGSSNTASGMNALNQNTTGNSNSAHGSNALYANTIGIENTAVGGAALNVNTTGSQNTAVGVNALVTNTTGGSNTAIGANADVFSNGLINATAIGSNAKVSASNSLVLGGTGSSAVKVGIGVTAPVAFLDVAGNVKISDGTQGTGKVLTSDANGLATWAIPSGGWGLTGTSGTIDGTNFIGTTDNVPLNFKVNNVKAGRIDATSLNTFFGYMAGQSITTGNQNTGIGFGALQSNADGYANTALGINALRLNSSGTFNTSIGYSALSSNTTGTENTAHGNQALGSNSTGASNTATGSGSLRSNLAGAFNTANGTSALSQNTSGGNNVAVGDYALFANSTASNNTATGSRALFNNSTGGSNTANGYGTLFSNTTGAINTALGQAALQNNVSGNGNTALGYYTLTTNTTGTDNTAIGDQANVSSSGLTNATAIGALATVNASNKVRIGNTSVTVIEGQVGFTAASDQRLKKDIQTLSDGLDFILKLKPVSYKMKSDESGKTNWGFIAQDIEKLIGKENAMLTIGGDKDRTLGLRYTDFVAPLVKAVQEQQKVIEDLKTQNSQKNKRLQQLEASIDELKSTMSELNSLKSEMEKIKSALSTEASIGSRVNAKK